MKKSFCAAAGWRVSWREEFDGERLNTSVWNVEQGAGTIRRSNADCRGQSCIPLGSCRDAYCHHDNVRLSDGQLILTSQRREFSGRKFTTGAVNTWGKLAFRGDAAEGAFRMCISARLPGVAGHAAGVWPAHWLMPHDDSCDPDEGEMDVMEMVDGDGTVYSTYHWQDAYPRQPCAYPQGHRHVFAQANLSAGWNATFHEWAVERGPGHVAFALDGKVLLNATSDAAFSADAATGASSRKRTPSPPPKFWDKAWYLIINTAIGGGWPGPVQPDTVFPITHAVDYVRVARRAVVVDV